MGKTKAKQCPDCQGEGWKLKEVTDRFGKTKIWVECWHEPEAVKHGD